MPDAKQIVVNTSPLLALIAAWGRLDRLQALYARVLVPFEVCEEIRHGGKDGFGVTEFQSADFLDKQAEPLAIAPFLRNSLDRGEAAVTQLALDRGVRTVCIDELVGRRVARLNDLELMGSVGVLVRAYRQDQGFSVKEALRRMQEKGIRLGDQVVEFALREAGD